MGATNNSFSSWDKLFLLYKPRKKGKYDIKKDIDEDSEEVDNMGDYSLQDISLEMVTMQYHMKYYNTIQYNIIYYKMK